jgi:hypothetical protein
MQTKTEVTVYECDGCGKRRVSESGEGAPIPWYVGDVMYHHNGGGFDVSWDACSPRCFRKALENALDKGY